MESIKDFGNASKSLARNPLGIIALFLVLVYAMASLVFLLASKNLDSSQRLIFTWFFVLFPVVVFTGFYRLVSKFPGRLYAPSDFADQEHFLRAAFQGELEPKDVPKKKFRIPEGQLSNDGGTLDEFFQTVLSLGDLQHEAKQKALRFPQDKTSIEEKNVGKYLRLEKRFFNADFGVQVVGDSMKDAGILSGDIALIRQQPLVEMGDIAVVIIHTPEIRDLNVLKRYYVYRSEGQHTSKAHWFLKSDNSSSPHLVVMPAGASKEAIRETYAEAIRDGRVSNPIWYYEEAEISIAGKFVGLVRR